MKPINLILIVVSVLFLGINGASAQCDISYDFENNQLSGWANNAGTTIISQQESHSGTTSIKMSMSSSYPELLSAIDTFSIGRYTSWFYVTGYYSAAFFKFNYQDANNYYQVGMMPSATDNPKLVLVKKVNGVQTELFNIPPVFGTLNWFKMNIEYDALGLISVYINDVFQASATDLSITNPGKVSVMGYDYTTYFDDFCYEVAIAQVEDSCDISYDFENNLLSGWANNAGTTIISQQESHSGTTSVKMSLNSSYPELLSTIDTFSTGHYTSWFYVTGYYSAAFFKFNYQDANNYYQVGMMPATTDNPKLVLYKKVNGIQSELFNIPPIFGTLDWFKMNVEYDSMGLISVYINDVFQASATDLSITNPGKVSVMGYDYTTYFDDFCYVADVEHNIVTDTCIYSYDFETGNLNDWNILSGNFSISSTEIHSGLYSLTAGTEGVESIIVSDDAPFNYGKYSFWTYADGDYTKLSFLFNYFDQDNYYLLNLNPDNTNQPSLDLEKTVGGVTSTLFSATPLFTTYEWTYIQVERESSGLISVLVDNTLQYQINDLDHTGLSKIGFKSKEPTSYVDDFCFEEYAIFNEIGKEQQAKISLYPNPGTDLVRITGLNELTVFVYNVQGKLLFSTNEKSIDTQAMESGIYIFKIFDSKGYSENLKFVKR